MVVTWCIVVFCPMVWVRCICVERRREIENLLRIILLIKKLAYPSERMLESPITTVTGDRFAMV